jgi:hypothetical protein
MPTGHNQLLKTKEQSAYRQPTSYSSHLRLSTRK